MIRYYLREYEKRQPVTDPYATYLSETIKIWYPLDYVETPVARINNIPVDRNFVIIDSKSNDETGSLWGIPDAPAQLALVLGLLRVPQGRLEDAEGFVEHCWQVKSKTAKAEQTLALSSSTTGKLRQQP